MRVILQYANQLRKISALLVSELEQMVNRMNAWANVEHLGSGRHGDISVTGIQFLGDTQSTVGAAGAASALPATPSGYLVLTLSDDSEIVVPYYAKS